MTWPDSSMSINENWKPVPGYDGYYEASYQGKIRSVTRQVNTVYGATRTHRGKVLRAHTAKGDPHLRIALSRENDRKTIFVHFLVCSAFHGPRPQEMEVCHINGDAKDNRADNLRWGTRGENMVDKQRHGTDHQRNKTHCPQGHEYTPENIIWDGKHKTHRRCKECNRVKCRKNHARRKASK